MNVDPTLKSTFIPSVNWTLLPVEVKILLAVSGGADSTAMLHAVDERRADNVIVGHINHNTRGDENAADAAFVRQLCEERHLPFCAQNLDIKDHSEAALRTARYAALLEMAHQHHCSRIATAHTASDVLESLLLNFLRDASIQGWNGIAAQRNIDAKVLLVRPLLAITREEVLRYLQDNGQTWREDSSNKSTFYKRNAVRHRLLPVLDELVPQGIHQLAKQAARIALLARDENDFWETQLATYWDEITMEESQGLLIWNGARFAQLHPAVQRRLLRCAVRYFCDKTNNLDFARIEEVRCHIAADGRNKVWQWRGGIAVHWTGPASGRRIRISRQA